ncbi:MAG: hypothetical protein F4Y27_10950 [Acidimicrobiaceae bacterium]|nr:hypothetical protein [Acidimicrobiaceae bacterium]MXW76299.1 hypothetical protein [Acidimicrobiaceae bacterium]MYA75181.1 hypothetical protein [Acidimicrobiaceae bacterium]MYC42980.1 hypothetical protein [Acidimicrobiaceae bacterium]MYD07522.1 hypothetical protein [Acidimicrobiaceae bacterium]
MPALDFDRNRWSWLALLTALATGVVLSFLPVFSTASCEAVAGGSETCTTGSESLLENEGASALAVLAVPVFVAAIGAVFARRGAAITTAVLLTVLTLLGAASLGLFYVPTTVLAWFAVAKHRDHTGRLASQG